MAAGPYVVKQGECLSSIAFDHGFFAWSLWELGDNAELRANRASPFVLQPGDVVHIPPLRQRELEISSGSRHVFRRKGVPAKLEVHVREYNEPLAQLPYVLEYGGVSVDGTTDDDGLVEAYVPPDVPSATLRVGEPDEQRVYTLALRTLNPTDDAAGLQGRLANLGYYTASVDGELSDATVAAIRRFQVDQKLPETGEADEATLDALTRAYEGAS